MSPPSGLRPTPFSPRYPEIEEWIDVYGYAVPLSISSPASEYDAIRRRVALLEYSMLYKFHVEGPDAVAVVDATVSRDVRGLKARHLAYGVIVNEDGTMLDDITVAVLAPDHVVVTGGNPDTESALRSSVTSSTTVTERRDESAVLAMQGPDSRALLRRLTDTDVSNGAFPYYTFVLDVDVAGIPTTINRIGFTAELGYELIVPRDRALELWDAVLAAGDGLGVAPVGAAALMMARIESAMIMGEVEYDHTVSPFECRMGWSVDFDKGPFRGRSALLARKEADTGRVMTIRIEGAPEVSEGKPLWRDGIEVGIVTMAVPSPQLAGATLAMARLHRDAAAVGTELVVKADDVDLAAQVTPTPVYDPHRVRVRS
jgi:aminomethyltransferase